MSLESGSIGEENVAEAHYNIAAIKDGVERGEEPSDEAMRDADVVASLFKDSNIDWDRFGIKLAEINKLEPEEAQRQLNEAVSALILSGEIDDQQVNMMQRVRNVWKGKRLPIAAAAAIVFMAGCQAQEKKVDPGNKATAIEQPTHKAIHYDIPEIVNQDVLHQWMLQHPNVKDIKVLDARVSKDSRDRISVDYSADVKIQVTLADGKVVTRYGIADEPVGTDLAQADNRALKAVVDWVGSTATRKPQDYDLTSLGDNEFVGSTIVYRAVNNALTGL